LYQIAASQEMQHNTPLFGIIVQSKLIQPTECWARGKEENMKKQILFIQGGGEGAHAVDEDLAKSLRDTLGSEYNVRYPKMPEEENAGYEAWKAQISKELAEVDDQIIFVGHSVGTSMLLKYLSEENVKNSIAGIFLIAAPYWGMGGWQVEEFILDEDSAAKLLKAIPIFFYHSRDDDIVPFTHLALHAQKFPQATVRVFDGRGHQFNNDLSEVAADIKSL
jgi:predicted alpha/beta hydrolase family esterase